MSNLTDKIKNQFEESPVSTDAGDVQSTTDYSKLNPAYFNRGRGRKSNAVPEEPIGISSRNSVGTSRLGSNLAGDYVYQGQNVSTPNPFASDYFNSKWMGIDFGEVYTDHKNTYTGINPYSKALDFEYARRNAQTNAGALANLLTQYVGKTAVNVAGGIVGGFYSLGAAGLQGLKNLGEDDETQPSALKLLYDNSVNRSLDKATDWVENNNSVFTSQKAREQLGLFTVENVKDVSDAYSFISGAVLSELILEAGSGGLASLSLPSRALSATNRLSSNIAKTIGLSKNLQKTGNYITRAEEAAKLVKAVDVADKVALETLAKNFGSTVDDIIRYKKTLNSIDNVVRSGRQIVSGTMWEAGLEARHSHDGLIASQTQQLDFDMQNMKFDSEEEKEAYKQKELARIKDMAELSGSWAFGLNVGVLGVSNHIQFPTIFGAKNVVKPDGLKGAFKKNLVGEYVKSGGKMSDILRITGTALKSPITEFTEETLQGAINSGTQSYYESMLGTRTANGELTPGVANLGDAIMKGLKDAYGTEAGRHEGYIGALVGAIGIPLLRRNKAGKLRKFEMSGGIGEAINEYRDKNNAIKESIGYLGLDKYEEVLNYNKDNAILASLDAKKENVATYNNDQAEIENIKNNKIFRHVKDRLDKGLESYLDSDIEEIKNMTLDEYKTKFQKSDSFTQADKNYEVSTFAEKAGIYKDAYKRVYEGLRAEDMNNNHMTKKLFDVLTYSLANEKIYKTNQEKLITELLSNKDLEMSRAELLNYAKYSDRFKDYEKQIDDLAKEIKKSKVDAFDEKVKPFKEKLTDLRSKVSEKNQKLIDDLLSGNEEASSYIDSITKLQKSFESENYKDLAEDASSINSVREELERTHKELTELEANRNKETRFSKSQFGSKTRDMINKKVDVLNQINEDEYNRVRKSLELLKGKSTKVTQTELDEYFELKEKVNQALLKKEDSEISFMDQAIFSKNVNLKNQLNSLREITAQQVLALKIATNLYGLDKVNNSFKTIVESTMNKSMEDITNNIALAGYALKTFDEDLIAEVQSELELSLENVKDDLNEYRESLTEESAAKVEEVLLRASQVNDDLRKFLNIVDEKEENEAQTKGQEAEEREEKAIKKITDKEKKDETEEEYLDKEEEGVIEGEEFDNTSKNISKNLHTIKPVNPKQKDNIELKRKIDSGEIKYNSGVIISYLEKNETNEGLIKYLEDKNLKDSYFKGKIKVADNPEVLNEDFENLDADVKTFITHAPVDVNIYNKEVSVISGEQHFNPDEDDTISHNFLYYSPTFENNKTVENYKEKKDSIIKKAKADKKVIYDLMKSTKKDKISKEEYAKRRALIEKNLDIAIADIEAQAFTELNNINDLTLFNFRKALLYNKFQEGGVNELKMRLGNIINGYLEKYGDTEYEVEEFALNDKENWLVQDMKEFDWSNLMYGDQSGKYKDFVDGNTVKINRGSRLNKANAINSRLYLKYTTVNNQSIPILLNRGRLNSNEDVFGEIMYQLEKYFDKKKPNEKIKIKNKKLNFLEGKTYKEFFASFMDINNSKSRFDGSLATFNIIEGEGEKSGSVMLGNFNVEIKDKDHFLEHQDEITNAIGSMRFYLDAASIKKDGNMNKEFLDFIVESKLINHSFNASKNYDRIFNKKDKEGNDFVKSIQLHPLNSQFKISKTKKPRVNDVYSLRDKIFGGANKSNLSLINVFYNINAAINTEARKVYRSNDDISYEDAILEAFDNVMTKKEEEILDLAKTYPEQYTEAIEEKLKKDKSITFPKNESDRKAIDNALRILYLYKNWVRENNQQVFTAFIDYLKNADYESDYKKILLDPKLSRVKLTNHESVDGSITDEDGETTSKIQFKLTQSEELSSGTKEENKEAITNILEGFKRLKSSTELFAPEIYNANKTGKGKKQSNNSKIFFDFSKKYTNKDGSTEYGTVHEHKYDNKERLVRTADLKEAYQNNLASYTSKEGKVHKPVRFFIQKNGEEVEINDLSDFKYNANGTLANGIVRVYYSDLKGYVHSNVALVGTENDVYTNEYMASIKLPGVNGDFSINEESVEKIDSLMSSFQVKFSKINKATIDPHVGKSYMKDKVDLRETSEEDEDDFLTEATEALKKPLATKSKSETNKEEDVESFISDDENPVDNFLTENPQDGSSGEEVFNALNEVGTTKKEKDKSDKNKSKLSIKELREFRADKSIWTRKLNKEITKEGLAKYNINTYEDFKHMLTYVYSQDLDLFKKYITFAQKLFNVEDNDIFKCN